MTTFTSSSSKLSTFKDDSSPSNDIYIVGNDSKGLNLTGQSTGDIIQINGLSTDYTFKAAGRTLTVTNVANPKQIITVQLIDLANKG